MNILPFVHDCTNSKEFSLAAADQENTMAVSASGPLPRQSIHTMIGHSDVWNTKACMQGVPGAANDTKAVRLKLCSDQIIDMTAGRVG